MSDTLDELKNAILIAQKQAYYDGVIDTFNNIIKALNKAKELTGTLPTMETFINDTLPKMIKIEEIYRKEQTKL